MCVCVCVCLFPFHVYACEGETEKMKESSKILKDGVYGLELKYYPSFQIQGG